MTAPGQLPQSIIDSEEYWPPDNCPLEIGPTIKSLPKIITSTQVNSPQRVLRVN